MSHHDGDVDDRDDDDDHDVFDNEHSDHNLGDHNQSLAVAWKWCSPLVGGVGAMCYHVVLDGGDFVALVAGGENDFSSCLLSLVRFNFESIKVPQEANM